MSTLEFESVSYY